LGGTVLSRTTTNIPAPSPLNLFQSSIAYVGDYSFFGFTSPITGSRFRFEASPTFGSLDFVSALADYRRYLFTNPFTFAFRGIHYGRYLGDSEDPRISPLTLGNDAWVRGYDIYSISSEECTDAAGGCPEIDRLLGSKMAIFNFETRIPLFGTEQYGLINFPYFPLELSAFFDAGIAWNRGDNPVFEFARQSSERIPVMSTGIAARVNILGYIVVQAFYAYPFQRPVSGSRFGFLISPGW
jgi:outer membrane protein assembly factor BamA